MITSVVGDLWQQVCDVLNRDKNTLSHHSMRFTAVLLFTHLFLFTVFRKEIKAGQPPPPETTPVQYHVFFTTKQSAFDARGAIIKPGRDARRVVSIQGTTYWILHYHLSWILMRCFL